MAWSDERVAILKKMWLEGSSASEIAKELGNITRNAVIGKVHRLGMSNRDTNNLKSGSSTSNSKKSVRRGRPPKVNKEEKKRGRPHKLKDPGDFPGTLDLKEKSTISSAKEMRLDENKTKLASDLSEENIKAFDILTNNVFRLKLAFPLSELNERELKLLPIWCEFITQLGAGKDSYKLVQQKRAAVGEFEVNCHFSSRADEGSNISGFITVSAKGLNRKIDEIVTVAATLIQTARFDENERLIDLLKQTSNEYEHSMVQRGHYLAMLSSARHLNKSSGLEEMWSGCSFINDLKKVVFDGQDKIECGTVFEIFKSIRNKVLRSDPLIMSTTDRQNLKKSVTTIKSFYNSSPSVFSEISIKEKRFEKSVRILKWVKLQAL